MSGSGEDGRSPVVRVCLLGPPLLEVDGTVVPVPGRLRLAVLAMLALAEGRAVSVGALIDGLWPVEPPPTGVSALHSHISRLRGHLGPAADRLRRFDSAYALDLRDGELDVTQARRLATEVAGLRSADPGRAAAVSERALRLWRGTALDDFADVPPLAAAAVGLDELRRRLVDDQLQAEVDCVTAGVAERAAAAAAADPLRERTVVIHMLALAGEGRAAEALQVAGDFRRRLADDTGLDPSPALRDAEQRVAAGTGPPPRAAAAAPVTPRPVGPFVGREHDRAELLRLLDLRPSGPVTVVGPGGVGKTRLALEVVADVRERGDVEVAVVSLAAVVDPGGLAGAVAAGLGLALATVGSPGDADPDPALAAVADALAGRRLLLLLDNCEHLVDRCRALIEAMLAVAPGVHVLATSRVSLHASGEYVMRLQPLPLPRDVTDPDGYARQPSIAAFVEHAQRRNSAYRLTAEDAPVVADIVSRLDGLPLAIELAAGRAASMPLAALRGRLHRALHALGGDRPGGPGRHRTLHDTVDWSFRLLDDEEQRLLLALGPMAGGADLETLEELASGTAPDREPLSLIARLVDCSLLVAHPDGRYDVLETVRAYVLEELDARGERAAAERDFVAWARRTSAELRRDLQSSAEPAADRRLRRELPNLRAALSVARDADDLDAMADIALSFDEPSIWRGLPELWLWIMEVAERAERARHPRRVEALGSAAECAWLAGSLDRADDYVTRAGAADDVVRAGAAESALWRGSAGALALFRGDFARSEELWRAGAELTDRPSAMLASAALAACYGGRPTSGLLAGARAAVAARPYPSHAAYLHYVTGEIASVRGDLDEATAQYEAAIGLARSCGCFFVEGVAMVGLASAWVAAGRPVAAADGYRDLLDRWYRAGSSTQLWTTARNAARLLVAHGDAPQTAALLLAAADAADAAAAVTGRARIELDDLRRRAADGMSDAQRSALSARARTMPIADILDEASTALATVR